MTQHVAMHISNGIVNGPISAAFGGLAIIALAVCVARARGHLDDRLAPMAGLVAAFIFAVQMLNFPVVAGVSGHLLGGTLAAMLVGPWIGALCVSTVLIVQSLLFADGGLTALGLNITNMALIGTAAGYLVIVMLLKLLPKTITGIAATAFIASVVSVTAASQGFVLEYWLGGTTALPLPLISGTMAGVHVLIGIGEGLIAATTVATVAKVRPDLVYALRPRTTPKTKTVQATTTGWNKRLVWFLGGGLLVSLALAGVVSNFASSSPDGLDATTYQGCEVVDGHIIGGTCMAQQAQDHQMKDSLLADYGVKGITDPVLSNGLAGVAGVLVTFGAGAGAFWLIRRRRARQNNRDRSRPAGHTHAGHTHSHEHVLHRAEQSAIHRLPPEVKIVATVLFTVVVVVTPREEFWAFAGYGVLLALVAVMARVPALWLAKRATIELPFVVLALVLPFVGPGERVEWLGLSLSVDGLYGGWNIVIKGTLGVIASLLLAATTTMRDLLAGLDRLRCPQIIVQIATFMLRYLSVLGEEARRMRVARLSRGYDPRFLWQVKAFAIGVGALFLRAFERGERVYLAMVSRSYTGRLPAPEQGAATAAQWSVAALLPVAAVAIAIGAVIA